MEYWIIEENVTFNDSGTSIQDGSSFNADFAVIRNNIWVGFRRAVGAGTHPAADSGRQLEIYNNTAYHDDPAWYDATQFGFSSNGYQGSYMRNNLVSINTTSGGIDPVDCEGVGLCSDNWAYNPRTTGDCTEPDGTVNCVDPVFLNTTDWTHPDFMKPTNPLGDGAGAVLPIWTDFHGVTRSVPPGVGAVKR
jgi:hypothetical protein